jgi:hypothetical protein
MAGFGVHCRTMAVSTLDSPLRRGERTNMSWLTGLVSSRTSIMPITLPHAKGRAHRSGVRALGSDPGLRR